MIKVVANCLSDFDNVATECRFLDIKVYIPCKDLIASVICLINTRILDDSHYCG